MKPTNKANSLHVKDKDITRNNNDISGNSNTVTNYSVYNSCADSEYINLIKYNSEVKLLLQKALNIIKSKDILIRILLNERNKRKVRKSK